MKLFWNKDEENIPPLELGLVNSLEMCPGELLENISREKFKFNLENIFAGIYAGSWAAKKSHKDFLCLVKGKKSRS